MRMIAFLGLTLLVAVARASLDLTKLGTLNPGCDVSEETLTKYGMECLAHDPSLMLQIIEHMQHPDTMANMKFVCDNQRALVDVAMCMEGKMSPCLPQEFQAVFVQYVTRPRLESVLGYVCEHQAELSDDCMGEQASLMFQQCMQVKGQEMGAALGATSLGPQDIRGLLCRFDSAFDGCLSAHHGSCTGKFVTLVDQVVKKMLPADICAGVDLNGQKASSKLLSSLLLHGAPLTFEPESKMGMRYNNKRLGYNIHH